MEIYNSTGSYSEIHKYIIFVKGTKLLIIVNKLMQVKLSKYYSVTLMEGFMYNTGALNTD